MRWTTLLSAPLPSAIACIKDARSDKDGHGPTPPTYILDPPHFYYHDQDSCPDMIPIKIYDTQNPMKLAMRVELLELVITTFENFKLIKESGCNYYFFWLPTHNDEVRLELILEISSSIDEGLVIPLDNEKDVRSVSQHIVCA